jgi:hypothetical protein
MCGQEASASSAAAAQPDSIGKRLISLHIYASWFVAEPRAHPAKRQFVLSLDMPALDGGVTGSGWPRFSCHLQVDRGDLACQRGPGVPLGGGGQPGGGARLGQNAGDGRGQGGGVAGRHQQAVDVMVDQGGDPADPAGDDRQAGGHALDQHRGQFLVPGGRTSRSMCCSTAGIRTCGAKPVNRTGPASGPRLLFGSTSAGTVAHNEQAGRNIQTAMCGHVLI